jgi:hypothetical protein
MLKYAFYIFSCLLAVNVSGQNTTKKILLDHYVEDEKGKKLQSIIAVYKYTGQPFEDPINNGIETKKEFGKFYAKLPNMTGVRDTSYAYIYFGALGQNKDLKGYVLTIIGHNTRQGNQPSTLLWIDRNYNLDLTDDGAPDTFSNMITQKDIVLYHPTVKNATYTVNISRFAFSYNAKYIGMLDDYYKENSGSKKFAGALYSFKEQRINTIAGDYKSGNDSFRIAVKDVNCNGLFNDAETDYILIGPYKANVMPENIIPIERKAGKTFFEWNGKHYNVLHIDQVGAYINIQWDDQAPIVNALVAGKKIKKFKFQSTEKDKASISIRKYRKKPTYIYVWRFDQPGFAADTAILRIIARDFSDKVNLLTLNYGETPKELKAFKKRNHINWTIGQSTMKINEKLFINKYPTGILTQRRLKVKQVSLSPSELLLLLRNNQI